MKIIYGIVVSVLLLVRTAEAQDKFHIFPQIADGVYSDGNYFKSTFMIVPWFDSTTATCSLRTYGISIALSSGRGNSFTINFSAGSYYVQPTAADQPIQFGYATLTCSDYVFAQVLYTSYAKDGT